MGLLAKLGKPETFLIIYEPFKNVSEQLGGKWS